MVKEVLISTNQTVEAKPTLSRRQFLRGTAALGGALLLDHVIPTSQAQAQALEASKPQLKLQPIPPSQPQLQPKSQDNEEQNDETPSLMDTAKETVVFTAAKLTTYLTLKSLGVPITPMSNSVKYKLLNKPVQAFAEGVVLAPPLEEALFRFLPSWILSHWTKDTSWGVGVPVSLAFAYTHNFQDIEPNKYTFLKDKLPISHFMAGLYFWKLMRERGFSHATTAHGVGNFASQMTARLLNKFVPDKL